MEKLPPPRPPQLLAHRTLAHMKLLLMILLLNLIRIDSNLQVPNSSSKINTPLRLNVNLSSQRRAQLQLRLAVCQLCGLFAPGLLAYAVCDSAGDGAGVRENAPAVVDVCDDLGFCLGAFAEVEVVEDFVEVGDSAFGPFGIGGGLFRCLWCGCF